MSDANQRKSSTSLGNGTRIVTSAARMALATPLPLDTGTQRAASLFMARITKRYVVDRAILFGSRARRTHSSSSDADIAVVLKGERGKRSSTAIDMAGVAFDVMLETGILIEALPLWGSEMERPELFSNPALIRAIQRDGVAL